jgi:hypothetical protein
MSATTLLILIVVLSLFIGMSAGLIKTISFQKAMQKNPILGKFAKTYPLSIVLIGQEEYEGAIIKKGEILPSRFSKYRVISVFSECSRDGEIIVAPIQARRLLADWHIHSKRIHKTDYVLYEDPSSLTDTKLLWFMERNIAVWIKAGCIFALMEYDYVHQNYEDYLTEVIKQLKSL